MAVLGTPSVSLREGKKKTHVKDNEAIRRTGLCFFLHSWIKLNVLSNTLRTVYHPQHTMIRAPDDESGSS